MLEPDDPSLPAAARDREPDSITLDTRSLRALAHPVRVRLLSLLRRHGPSTATRLAEELGLNSGATSYHLRQLAAAGIVEEDTDRGTGRDRWWRSAHRSTYFEPTDLSPADRPAGAVYLQAVTAEYVERLQQAPIEYAALPVEWKRAGDLSDFRLRLTPEETERLVRELHAIVVHYRRADDPSPAPPDAEVVVTQIQVMPQLDETAGDALRLDRDRPSAERPGPDRPGPDRPRPDHPEPDRPDRATVDPKETRP